MSSKRRVTSAGAVVLIATAGLAGNAGTAHAETTLKVNYPVTGTTFVKATDSTMELGPGTLKAALVLETGDLTASLELPQATSQFKQFGVIPVSAKISFIEASPTTGRADPQTGAVKTTSKVTLKLSDLRVAGIWTPVGSGCQTESPAVITVASGSDWTVLGGGTLSGTYTIPKFEHCLLATPLINITVPGEGNTIKLKLGPATFPGS
ncbi:hypothetical protein [Spirillospora sp. CA-294931]|uniref:hypothetical protein n=1 Tax=Spirillospora sp. CA-294931 TaxID=3240042 RepID=UPI003D938540